MSNFLYQNFLKKKYLKKFSRSLRRLIHYNSLELSQNRENQMVGSLEELMILKPTRKLLIESLIPKSRTIHLDPVTENKSLNETIEETLFLITNSFRYSTTPITLVLFVKDTYFRRIHFPYFGKESGFRTSTNNIPILLTLLKTIQKKVKTGTTSTIRDVYYSNVELYQEQRNVVYWLDVITKNFKLRSRDSLKIVAAQKGLIYTTSPIQLTFQNKVHTISDNTINLVPYLDEASVLTSCHLTSDSTIMILEKEAIFNKLVTSKTKTLSNYIVITGKGYSDHLTKLFLRKLLEFCNNCHKKVKFAVYVDSDPDGICIAMNYIMNCNLPTNSGLNRIIYKGVTLLQLIALRTQLMSLTQRELKLAKNLLIRLATKDNNTMYPGIKLQLQRQLFFCKKGEMNAFYI